MCRSLLLPKTDLIIYHNPRCRKSRETLALLRENGVEPTVVEYLKNPMGADAIKDLLGKLGIPALDLVRKGEAVYKEQFKGKDLSEAEWVTVLADHPKLMERPVVVAGDKAVIGRPPENAMELL